MGTETSPYGLFASESLVHILNLNLPSNSTAVEVGVFRAYNLVKILENCNLISKIYGVDKYEPYVDYIEVPTNTVDQEKINRVRAGAYKEISLSKDKDKIVLLETDSISASKLFEDNSLDFIFLDSYLTKEDVEMDIDAWYPKLKQGGVFAGHDWEPDNQVDLAIKEFGKKNNINNISFYDMVWVWIK